MVILNLYRIPFHAVVVLDSEHDFLFKSTSTHCVILQYEENIFLTEHCKIKQKKCIFDQPNQKVIITSSISST